MDAAECAERSGTVVSDLTILIGHQCGVRMIAGSDWPLEGLGRVHGAEMAYRISRHAAGIRLEGRGEGRRCVLETASPAATARLLLGS